MSIDNWLGVAMPLGDWLGDVAAATDIQRIINDKATSITLYRNGVAQDAQTFRVEFQLLLPSDVADSAHTAVVMRVWLFGVPDADIQHEDLFKLDGQNYRVLDVVTYPQLTQGYAERIT